MNSRRVVVSLIVAAGMAASARAQVQGPSTLQGPQMLPSHPGSGTLLYSIASNGNGVSAPNETFVRLNGPNPYRLIGLPDGMGVIQTAQDVLDGTVTLTCNHENGANTGIVRDHGSRGSSVSLWRVNITPGPDFMKVVGGEDLIQQAKLYNTVLNVWETYDAATNGVPLYSPSGSNSSWNAAGAPNANPNRNGFGRFCSADLADATAFGFGALGTDARIHINGEEIGAVGRAFAHIVTGPEKGTSYELPSWGDYSWENAVACPHPQAKTIVIGLDDATLGNIYIHIGNKLASGNDAERAGLLNAVTYGIVIAGVSVNGSNQPIEHPTFILGNSVSGSVESKPFTTFAFGDCTQLTGAQRQSVGDANGVVNWLRPEDGVWDPLDSSRFYFVTTDSFNGNRRIWVLDFTDITQPELGAWSRCSVTGLFLHRGQVALCRPGA